MKTSFSIRAIATLAMLAGAWPTAGAADRLYLDAGYIEPGETVTLSFSLDNGQPFYGFQADITLPEGVEILSDANSKPEISLSERAGSSYTLLSNATASGVLRVGAFSASHTPISGDSGALLHLNVRAARDFTGGELKITGILFTDARDHDVSLPDYSVWLRNEAVNSLFVPDFSIRCGETLTMSVNLDNETSFTAFQTDLFLPGGLSADALSLRLTGRASESHSLSSKSYGEGRTRVICMAADNTPFSGDTGAVLTFDVTLSPGCAASSGEIKLRNTVCSTPDATEYYLPDTSAYVEFMQAQVTGILLSSTSAELIVGERMTLTATVLPEYAVDQGVIWSGSDEEVVTVDESGNLTAVGAGEATVTATSADNPEVSASCTVRVRDTQSGVAEANGGDYMISVGNGLMLIKGLPEGTEAEVFSVSGLLLESGISHGSTLTLALPDEPVVILRTGRRQRVLRIR